jgi:4-diphosphocytidyl-2-C-methyl-D-erythritol kinase
MICFPNAKINLGLRVLRKRTDGFHDIETVFVPIPLTDVLEVVPVHNHDHPFPYLPLDQTHRLHYSYSGNQFIGKPEEDLSIRACIMYAKRFGVSNNLHLHLHKHIPSGAGLGGGSSDAAHALLTLNGLEGGKVASSDLMQMAASLGSDCPFFLLNQPSHALGKGELLSVFDWSLAGYHLVLVKPAFGVSTSEAYSGVTIQANQDLRDLRELLQLPKTEWRSAIFNDFEIGVFNKHPQLSDIKNQLYMLGAFYASMSGSGSTMFGLFDQVPDISDYFKGHFTFQATL